MSENIFEDENDEVRQKHPQICRFHLTYPHNE